MKNLNSCFSDFFKPYIVIWAVFGKQVKSKQPINLKLGEKIGDSRDDSNFTSVCGGMDQEYRTKKNCWSYFLVITYLKRYFIVFFALFLAPTPLIN